MPEAGKSGFNSAIGERTWVSLTLVITFVGFAFWMGIQHSQLSTLNDNFAKFFADHETRIRVLEKGK